MSYLNRDVEPFSRFRPSHIELIFRRLNDVITTIVNRVVELGVRNIDAFMHTKFVSVASVRWIESATAIGIEVMIGDAFPTEIVVSTLNFAGIY